MGSARDEAASPKGPNPMRLVFIDETDPAGFDPTTQVALRVINAGFSAVDASYYPTSGAAPGTTIQTGLAALTVGTYVTAAPGTYRYYIQSGGAVIADGRAIAGAAA